MDQIQFMQQQAYWRTQQNNASYHKGYNQAKYESYQIIQDITAQNNYLQNQLNQKDQQIKNLMSMLQEERSKH